MKTASYGNELPQVQAAMAQSKADLQSVLDFAVNIDKCRTVLVSQHQFVNKDVHTQILMVGYLRLYSRGAALVLQCGVAVE